MSLPTALPCYATTAPGVESLLAGELIGLGIVPGEIEPGGVAFEATRRQLADALLWLRTANRVTVRIGSFHARTFGELERHTTAIPWAELLRPDDRVHFRVTSKKSRLYHNVGIAERLEQIAIAAVPGITTVRAAGIAEEIDEEDLRAGKIGRIRRIIVRLMRDDVTLSADAAGALLHMRGYRQAVAKAPLRETLAAALLLASGWTPESALFDPFCGSGTIAIEAAMIARRLAPGRQRRFAAEGWPGFGEHFAPARAHARSAELAAVPVAIGGADRDAGAIEAAIANAGRAGVAADVQFTCGAVSSLEPAGGTGWLVTNPPYGSRLSEREALRDLYAALGRTIRERRPGWQLAMLSADPMLDGQLGIAMAEVLATSNGGLPVRALSSRGGPTPLP